jgi:hypothetical protein
MMGSATPPMMGAMLYRLETNHEPQQAPEEQTNAKRYGLLIA